MCFFGVQILENDASLEWSARAMAAAESAPSGGRAYPMQEFVAHSGPVRVARLGTKSGQVLATGGEDKRVNVWKIGRTSALMAKVGMSATKASCSGAATVQ